MTTVKLLRAIFVLLFRLLAKVEVSGQEHVPDRGGCLLAVNHLSRIDPPLIYILMKRQDVTGLAADKYKKYPFFRWIINAVHGIWLNREEADIEALKAARDHLLAGGALGIAPEGTRSLTGALIQAKTGTAYLADKARVPIVPVAISGTDKAVHELFRLHRPHIQVKFGAPFCLPPVERRSREADLQRNSDEIMCRIAALLPPEYRGVYADHPRLQELLQIDSPGLPNLAAALASPKARS
jgi:1-acyl-sn-glycerol-3-phosphate acyltransferase